MKKIFAFSKRYLYMYKWRLFSYVLINIIVGATGLITPYLIGDFIDQLTHAESIHFIYSYFVIFAAVNIGTLLVGYITAQLYVRIQTSMSFALNKDVIMKLQHAPISTTSQLDSAYLNQRINSDSNSLITFCIQIIQSVLVNSVIAIVTLGLMFTFHARLAGVLVGVAVVYFVFYSLYKRVLYKANLEYQESRATFFAKLNEQLFNIRFIKLNSMFSTFTSRLNQGFNKLLFNILSYQRVNYIFTGVDKLVMIVTQMVLLLFGGMEIMAGRLTIGRFMIISSYFSMLYSAIRYFFGLGQTVQGAMVSYDRLQEFVVLEPEHNGTKKLSVINSIELRSVNFSYEKNHVLDNVNLRLAKGQVYVVVGPNGAGKSTLADIILGLQNGKYTGEVFYNGININEIDMYAARANLIGVSEQEPILLADTLAYNLHLGQADTIIDSKAFQKLIKILGLDAYIDSLPNHLETVINESATNISGGEKQKLSILRALLKDPDVLILDEPTSALDETSKASLQEYLDHVKADKIIIVITHDNDFYDSLKHNVVRIER